MGPRLFLQNVVLPNVADLGENYSDERRAFNAIASVDALAAHIFTWCQANAPAEIVGLADDTQYREKLAKDNSNFELVRDVAKAQKHVELMRGTPQVSSAQQIATRSLGWGQGAWGEGRWGGPPQVVVETDDGQLRVVDAVIANALAFLDQEMTRVGAPPPA